MTQTFTEYALQNIKTGEIDTAQARRTREAAELHLHSRRNQDELKIVERTVQVIMSDWK